MEILIICIGFIICFIAGGIISGGYKPNFRKEIANVNHTESQENRDLAALMEYFPDNEYQNLAEEVGI